MCKNKSKRSELLNKLCFNFDMFMISCAKCVDAHIHRKLLFIFFSRRYALVELRNLAKMKDTTETVCKRNSSEAAQHNVVKLCSYEIQNV